jgi:hypothetical protein
MWQQLFKDNSLKTCRSRLHAPVDKLCRPWVIIPVPGSKVITAIASPSARWLSHPRSRFVTTGSLQGPRRQHIDMSSPGPFFWRLHRPVSAGENFVGNWNQASKSVLLLDGNVIEHVRA